MENSILNILIKYMTANCHALSLGKIPKEVNMTDPGKS